MAPALGCRMWGEGQQNGQGRGASLTLCPGEQVQQLGQWPGGREEGALSSEAWCWGGQGGVSWVRASCSTEESGPHWLPCPLGHPEPLLFLGPPPPIAQPLGSVGSRAFLGLLLPPVRVPRVQTIPIFLRHTQSSRMWRRTSRTIEFTPVFHWRQRERVRCLLASGCNGSRPGWGAARCVSAPTPFPSCFQNHPSREGVQPTDASASSHVKSLPFHI